MRKCSLYLVAVVVVVLFFIANADAQTKSDEAAVREVPAAFVSAWAKHDGRQLAKIMSENVDFVNVGGDWLHGRADFELYHTRLLSGPFKASSLKVLDRAVSSASGPRSSSLDLEHHGRWTRRPNYS